MATLTAFERRVMDGILAVPPSQRLTAQAIVKAMGLPLTPLTIAKTSRAMCSLTVKAEHAIDISLGLR